MSLAYFIIVGQHSLFWIVCRVCEYAREKAADNSINTLHNNAIFVRMLKFRVVEEDNFRSVE